MTRRWNFYEREDEPIAVDLCSEHEISNIVRYILIPRELISEWGEI
ncbi:MAG: hypothetical protein OXC39_06375 [Candidatus Dadabacteria bacterium]|nr:hypothetical protein [Candidatus Dadabacteria bacterium]